MEKQEKAFIIHVNWVIMSRDSDVHKNIVKERNISD